MSDFQAIQFLFEKHAPAPRPRLPPADEIRIAATRASMKRPGKSMRTPAYVLANMKWLVAREGSMRAAAEILGVHKSLLSILFKRHGVDYGAKPPHPRIEHKGISYRFDGKRYYVIGGNKAPLIYLHRVIWEEVNGPIPEGHLVVFKSKNYQDFSIENMKLVTRKDFARDMVASYRWRKAA